MLNIENESGFAPEVGALERIAEAMSERPVDLLLCDNDAIRAINRQYRGLDEPTDVLSFPFEAVEHAPLGALVISAEYAAEQAETHGHPLDAELALLLIHGMLHLQGFDHEDDEGEMREKERRWIERFGLPKSLILRSED